MTRSSLRELSVGVVGASVAGLSMTKFLLERGAAVSVFERSSSLLEERGDGIALDPDVLPLLGSFHNQEVDKRLVVGADGRVLWEKKLRKRTVAWSELYRSLHEQVPESLIRRGCAVTACDSSEGEAVIHLEGGAAERFDLVVGADGVGSVIRQAVSPGFEPSYLGYVAVRGHLDEQALPDSCERLRHWADASALVNCYASRSHLVAYWIPGRPGGKSLNWMWYRNVEGSELAEFMTGSSGGRSHWSLPPGLLPKSRRHQLIREMDELFPQEFSSIARATGKLALQPIFFGVPDRFCRGRVALVGDAAHVAVPHIGAGSSFAIQDAEALASALDPERLESTLTEWDMARRAATVPSLEAAVRLGRALQHAEHDWGSWSAQDFESWWKNLMAGSSLYFERDGGR